MNNYAIPTTILGTVLIALAISVAPVQEAQAVHTTIIADIVDQERIMSFRMVTVGGAITDAVIIPDQSVVLVGSVGASIVAGAVAVTITDEAGNTIVTDANGGAGDQLAFTAIGAGDLGIEVDLGGAATVDFVIYIDNFPEV